MRILHLVKSFSFGGAENHVRELANAMDSMGNHVFVISKGGQQNNMLNKGVKFISLKMKDYLVIFQVLYVVYIILKYKVEVVHAHQRLPVLIGSIAGKLTGTPVIVTVHGQTQYDLRSRLSKKIPDKFIFVRKYSYDQSAKYGIHSKRAIMIQNGVSVLRSDTLRDLNSICYVSRIDKRHSSVISLIIRNVIVPVSLQNPNVIFNVVGDGEYLPMIRKEAKLINDQLKREAIKIHGYIDDVKKIIDKAGLVMGVGRVAIETLSCGVPLLSINIKHFGGLVTRHNYSFFRENNFVAIGCRPPDANNILSSLTDYLENLKFWKKESKVLQKRVEEDFDIKKISGDIINIYNDSIEEISIRQPALSPFVPFLSRFL